MNKDYYLLKRLNAMTFDEFYPKQSLVAETRKQQRKLFSEYQDALIRNHKEDRQYIKSLNKPKQKAKKQTAEEKLEKKRRGEMLQRLKKIYRISESDYLSMIAVQDNKCGICNSDFKNTRDTHVDHCHETGKVRGLLCCNCNLALGFAKDNVFILDSMIKYIAIHAAV